MKIKSLLHLVVVLLAGQFLFSCSSAEYYKFSAQKPEAYNKIKEKPAAEPAEVQQTMSDVALAAANEEVQEAKTAPLAEASTAETAPAVVKTKTAEVVKTPAADATVSLEKREMTVAEAEALAMAKERLANMTKAEKKELKKEIREAYRQDRAGGANIIEIILAILLPPLAVFLHDDIGTSFWISIILWLLFIIPGIIYALLVVTDTI